MKARHSLLLTALFGLIFSMACTFSTLLPTQTPPPAVEAIPSPAPTRPQSAFIDGRTVSNSGDSDSSGVPVNNTAPLDTGASGGVQSQSQASGVQAGYQVQYQAQQAALAPVPVSVYYSPVNIYSVPVGCAPRYDWGAYYQIQRGDTLSNIAWRAGVTVQSLAIANCICNPNLIYAGQILRIPRALYVAYYPQYPQYPHYPQYPQYPQYPHYPQYPQYPPPQPTYAPQPTYPPQQPPVVVGSGLSVTPYVSINNNTINLPPDQLITISWPATFPAATDHVDFILIPPGYSSGSSIGMDGNLGDGASIIWNSVNGTQGTLQAVAYFQNGYPPQYSDSYYLIAGTP